MLDPVRPFRGVKDTIIHLYLTKELNTSAGRSSYMETDKRGTVILTCGHDTCSFGKGSY